MAAFLYWLMPLAKRDLFKGTRITVYDVLEYMAGGMSQQELLDNFPALGAEHLQAALMFAAAREMGLSADQGRQLALATFAGSTALAQQSEDPPELLRERVTSKGGTTFAALASLEASGVKAAFVQALKAAQQRARELGDEFA